MAFEYSTSLWSRSYISKVPIALKWQEDGWWVDFGFYHGVVGPSEAGSWNWLGLHDEFDRYGVYPPADFPEILHVLWSRIKRGDNRRIRLALRRLFEWTVACTCRSPNHSIFHGVDDDVRSASEGA